MTLIFKLDPDHLNQLASCTNRETHKHVTECSAWTTKVVTAQLTFIFRQTFKSRFNVHDFSCPPGPRKSFDILALLSWIITIIIKCCCVSVGWLWLRSSFVSPLCKIFQWRPAAEFCWWLWYWCGCISEGLLCTCCCYVLWSPQSGASIPVSQWCSCTMTNFGGISYSWYSTIATIFMLICCKR